MTGDEVDISGFVFVEPDGTFVRAWRHDYYDVVWLVRELEDGREVVVLPWSFGGAQLSVGRRSSGLWDDTWNYERVADAVRAARVWDGVGEPEGWHRHPFSGRRRPGGDPGQEFVRP